MDIAEKTRLLADMLEVDAADIKHDTMLDTIPTWDSMAALSLIALLEEHCGRSDIDGAQIRHMKTVGDVLNVIEKK